MDDVSKHGVGDLTRNVKSEIMCILLTRADAVFVCRSNNFISTAEDSFLPVIVTNRALCQEGSANLL